MSRIDDRAPVELPSSALDFPTLLDYFRLCAINDPYFRNFAMWDAREIRDALVRLEFLCDGGDGERLTRAAVLACGTSEALHAIGLGADVVVRDERRDAAADGLRYSGSALALCRDLLEDLRPLYGLGAGAEGPLYPEPAVKEALLNMLVHRDFDDARPSEIVIANERLSFANPGTSVLDPDAFMRDGFESAPIEPRNPTLHEILSRVGITTGSGAGLAALRASLGERGQSFPDGRLACTADNASDGRFVLTLLRLPSDRPAPGDGSRARGIRARDLAGVEIPPPATAVLEALAGGAVVHVYDDARDPADRLKLVGRPDVAVSLRELTFLSAAFFVEATNARDPEPREGAPSVVVSATNLGRAVAAGLSRIEDLWRDEVDAAVAWWVGVVEELCETAVPERTLDVFSRLLEAALHERIARVPWTAEESGLGPLGRLRGLSTDTAPRGELAAAARAAGVRPEYFPAHTSMRIAPGRVAVRRGGAFTVVWAWPQEADAVGTL